MSLKCETSVDSEVKINIYIMSCCMTKRLEGVLLIDLFKEKEEDF